MKIDEKRIRELVERHTHEHKGIRYRIALARVRYDPIVQTADSEPHTVYLDFRAVPLSGGDTVNLQLRLGDRAEDDVFLLDAIDGTIDAIVDDKLPPGTVEFL